MSTSTGVPGAPSIGIMSASAATDAAWPGTPWTKDVTSPGTIGLVLLVLTS